MSSKKIILSLFIIGLAVITGILWKNHILNIYDRMPLEELSIPQETRLLVIAPHCDDETLSSAGLIQRVLEEEGEVRVILVTNGDGSTRTVRINKGILNPSTDDFINLGYTRQQESASALETLGVSGDDIYFLGYPDGGLSSLLSGNWSTDNPLFNDHTQTDYSPYENTYRPNVLYAGVNVANDLTEIMKEFMPTMITYPHPDDKHGDHKAVNAFVKYAISKSDIKSAKELMYLVHRSNWPAPHGRYHNYELKPPAAMKIGTKWVKLTLKEEEQENKNLATQLYKTQMKTMGGFLLSFDRMNELFEE